MTAATEVQTCRRCAHFDCDEWAANATGLGLRRVIRCRHDMPEFPYRICNHFMIDIDETTVED